MKTRQLSAMLAFTALTLGASSAMAAPVSINGVLGSEWDGVAVANVTHADGAPTGNFGAPGNTTAGASYSVQVRDSGGYFYVGLKITGDASFNTSPEFANLYFDLHSTTYPTLRLGLEVVNHKFFVYGFGEFDADPYVTWSNTVPGTFELAIDNAVFANPVFGGNGTVTLAMSQSFGYSVAGGDSYGDNGLGTARLTSEVPEPESLALMLAGLGIMGWLGARGKRMQVPQTALAA